MAVEWESGWQPDWAVPPGEILIEILDQRGMTQSELARRMGRPIKTINEIVKGKAAITPESALQLELALGIAARFWNNLESSYREALARQAALAAFEKEAAWIKRFPIKELSRHGFVRSNVSGGEILSDLLRFFQVSNRQAWERHWLAPTAAFRGSAVHRVSRESVAAWLRWGELQALESKCPDFDSRRFRAALAELRSATRIEPFGAAAEVIKSLCCESGVVFVLTPELPRAPVSGSARWIGSNTGLLQLSLRHKKNDQFWFSFFHEAGHILLPSRKRIFIDTFDEIGQITEDETRADQFARDELIPPASYRQFLEANDLTSDAVRAFAERIGIAPGIVVGRLQRDKKLGPSNLNHLKKSIRWLQPPSPQR